MLRAACDLLRVIYCEVLSERGEDNPDLRRLDGGVDELVQLAVLHREVLALSDGGLRTGAGA